MAEVKLADAVPEGLRTEGFLLAALPGAGSKSFLPEEGDSAPHTHHPPCIGTPTQCNYALLSIHPYLFFPSDFSIAGVIF